MASTFVPSQYLRLHSLLQRTVASPSSATDSIGGSNNGSNDWYIAVDGLRNELIDLARAKPMDDAEKKEIEAGEHLRNEVFHQSRTVGSPTFLFSSQAKLPWADLLILSMLTSPH